VENSVQNKPIIELRSIKKSYGSNTIINDFNLTIKPGEKVGLIGRSGAGKSTIVNLLLRFYEPQQGTITIDGQNIMDVQQESLRSQIGLVTQDTSLLHRSVRDNIVYGRPSATEQEMLDAATRAGRYDDRPVFREEVELRFGDIKRLGRMAGRVGGLTAAALRHREMNPYALLLD